MPAREIGDWTPAWEAASTGPADNTPSKRLLPTGYAPGVETVMTIGTPTLKWRRRGRLPVADPLRSAGAALRMRSMSVTRVKPRAILALVATLAFFAAGCSRPTKFSTVLEGGFDPGATFRQHGYTVRREARGEGIRNAEHGARGTLEMTTAAGEALDRMTRSAFGRMLRVPIPGCSAPRGTGRGRAGGDVDDET